VITFPAKNFIAETYACFKLKLFIAACTVLFVGGRLFVARAIVVIYFLLSLAVGAFYVAHFVTSSSSFKILVTNRTCQ
jgi:hypothetical protein